MEDIMLAQAIARYVRAGARMTDTDAKSPDPTQGMIEPQAGLLTLPPGGQLVYKVMSVENFLRSIEGHYLYFNRVDSYRDFPQADIRDGEQLEKDRAGNSAARFIRSPDFSGADYYDRSRARTYACCFSLDNTDYIWSEYGNGGIKGKIGVVFDFAKLRARLNETLNSNSATLLASGERCHQLFSINYGMIDYVNWADRRANLNRLPNPIIYTYLKDKSFEKERELRVSLSAFGLGQFAMTDGSILEFRPGLQLEFQFGPAMSDGTIAEILYGPACDTDYVQSKLLEYAIATSKDGGPPNAPSRPSTTA
jgi:hypothetical protein